MRLFYEKNKVLEKQTVILTYCWCLLSSEQIKTCIIYKIAREGLCFVVVICFFGENVLILPISTQRACRLKNEDIICIIIV